MPRGTAQDANMNADMKKELIEDAKEFAHQAFENCHKEKDIATQIKHAMERKHHGVWHCAVGRNFGSFVTHETKSYIYFYHHQWAILLWKSISTYSE
ncbi:Dynein 8 kDa light chain [Diplonema papillatum]|nr:Dynein 8 kDa light chain [Diplonema papillatum]